MNRTRDTAGPPVDLWKAASHLPTSSTGPTTKSVTYVLISFCYRSPDIVHICRPYRFQAAARYSPSPIPDELDRGAGTRGEVNTGDIGIEASELGSVGSDREVDGAPQQEVFPQVVLEHHLH